MGFKMKPKSPLTKKLVGGQHRLPAELKQEILNSPAKKYKSDAQRKAVHASKAEQSPAKLRRPKPKPLGPKLKERVKPIDKPSTSKKLYPTKLAAPTKLSKKYTYSVTPDPKLDNKPKKGPMGLTRAELAKQANSKKNKESLKKFTKKSPAKLNGTGKRVGPGYADKIKRDREREEAKRKEQGKKMRKRALKDKIKKTTKAEKKTQ